VSEDRVEAVLFDNGGVEATGGIPVTLRTGTITNGSTLFVPAPGAAADGEVCDEPDELEVAA